MDGDVGCWRGHGPPPISASLTASPVVVGRPGWGSHSVGHVKAGGPGGARCREGSVFATCWWA